MLRTADRDTGNGGFPPATIANNIHLRRSRLRCAVLANVTPTFHEQKLTTCLHGDAVMMCSYLLQDAWSPGRDSR